MNLGVICDERFAEQLLLKIKQFINSKYPVEPSLIDLDSLPTLLNNDYFVSKKGTGKRTFLYLLTTPQGPAAFLYTSNQIYFNQMNFPHPNNINVCHSDTLIDGQVNIVDNTLVFTAFDLVVIDGVSIAQRSLSTRLGILQQDIIKPQHQSMTTHPHWHQPFKVEMTRHERSYGLSIIMQQPVQGLIFTPVRTPYASQGSIKLFQWNVVNSCSFKIQIIWDKERKAHYQLLIADQKTHKYFDDFSPEMELLREWKSSPPDGKIIDCIFDKEWETVLWENGYAGTVRKGGWKFVKFRNDKTMADDERKVKLHWKGFIDPVPLEIVFKINKLESNIEEMRTRWKMRERRQYTQVYQKLERRESTGSIHKSNQSLYVEEEFEEEEVISGGYVPAVGSSSVVGPVSGPVSGQASGSVSNQAPIQVPVKSPVKVQKEIVQESEPTSNNPTLEKIAEKSVLLQKQEAYFIPALPVALISKRTVEVVETVEEEEESPIDDVTLDRFSKLEKIVQQRMVVGVTQVMQVTQVTKDAIKEDTRDALKTDKELIPPKRQTDQPQSSSKKGKWLDMILN